MNFPLDYTSIVRPRLLIITGVGRSGTTTLLHLLGSMQPSVPIFEPAIMKYAIHRLSVEAFYALLFEDYLLPALQGRMNPKADDWSYWGHFLTKADLEWRQKVLARRQDALEYIKDENPLFIVKTNEMPMLSLQRIADHIMPIVRNGIDVIGSAMERGWYTDEWCRSAVESVVSMAGCPMFIEARNVDFWSQWNSATRAAAVWHRLAPGKDDQRISYESFCAEPEVVMGQVQDKLGIEPTPKTEQHLVKIKRHEIRHYQLDLEQIEYGERCGLSYKMTLLGYEI